MLAISVEHDVYQTMQNIINNYFLFTGKNGKIMSH